MSRIVVGIVLASSVAIVAACGSRGPLDDDGPLDAGTAADVMTADVSAIVDSSPPPPDAPVDAGQDGGGNIIACGTCLIGQCSQGILKCVQTPACQKTLQCVATTCLSGGSPDPACLFKCASGDVSGALQIFQIFQCVTGKCGADCNALLGGLLGGGGGKDAGKGQGGAQQVPPFAEVLYSRWPELASH